MAETGPAPIATRLAAGAAGGAMVGAALTLGEAAASAAAGSPLPPRAWAFLLAYYAPALALGGMALSALRRRRLGAVTLAWLACAVYAVVFVNHEVLRGAGRAPLVRGMAVAAVAVSVLGAAWAVARAGGHAAAGRSAAAVTIVAAYVVALAAAAGAMAPAPAAMVALPLIAALAAALVAWAAVRVVRWGRAGAAASLAVVAPVVAVLALHAAGDRRRAVLDEPQPEARAHAEWLRGKPNVVLVVLDTVRAANLSSYGYTRRTTPHLDAFAAGAVRFTQATTVSPWSVPAHASLFTGLFPPEHGAGRAVRDGGRVLRPAPLDGGFVTLAEALADRGYATAGISANLLVAAHMNLPQGFRYFDAQASPRRLPPGFTPLLARVQHALPAWMVAEPLMAWFPSAFRSAAEITDAALDWIGRRRPAGQPYFLFLNYMDAHTPFVERPGFSGRWPGRSQRLPPYGLATAAEVLGGARAISGEEQAHLQALYDDALSYLDSEVGRLLAALRTLPDADDTWIIVTADHGEALGEHGRLGHDCVMYQQVLHVPLVIRYPRRPGPWSPPAQPAVDGRPVQTVDIAPAVLTALGLPAPAPQRTGRPGMVAMADCFCAPSHPSFHGAAGAAVLVDGLKYIEEDGRPPLLFALGADPAERLNRLAQQPADAERLRAALEGWRGRLAALAPPVADPARHREREEALRALGYVQ